MNSAPAHSSPTSGSLRFRQLRTRLTVAGILTLVVFCAATAYDSSRSYRYTLTATNRELINVANALAEQTASTLKTVDLLLQDTARWYRYDLSEIPPGQLDRVLANRTAGVRQVSLVTIVDAQGIQQHRSLGTPPPGLDVSDRSYFIAQRDGTAHGSFVSEPLLTRSQNRTGIVLSRRLETAKGEFGGVVTAIVNLEELQSFYAAVNLGPGGRIQLFKDDGTLLASNPDQPQLIGRRFPISRSSVGRPVEDSRDLVDGRSVFAATIAVTDTPLLLRITRETQTALRPWRDEALRVGARTVILLALSAATLVALLRQLRRVETGERALSESEERYALAMEGANEGHWDWDLLTERLFLSPKMKTLHGQSPDGPIATHAAWSAAAIIHPDDIEAHDGALADHLAGRTARFECQYRTLQPDGSWCWLSARGHCLRDARGRPTRFVGSAMDVTASKQAQIEREHLEAQLRQSQKMEAVGTLAGGIAHDFNNILGAIMGYGELAQGQAPPGSAQQRHLDNVMHAAGRAKMLVDRILGFSRSGLGERTLINIQWVVEETLELMEAGLPSQIRLDRQLDAPGAGVVGDATGLHQVIMNLCTNAQQAMPKGGVLTVALERVAIGERRAVTRGAVVPGKYVRLIVQDTGAGIPQAVYERIFDPFFTTKQVGEGTGLGLSLVHGIVADLAGAIDVTTQPGHGTKFEILLPDAGEAPRPVDATRTESPFGSGETVMIIDDEAALVTLSEEILAQLGYEPVGFGSSPAALAAFRSDPDRFDAVLSDESMPEMTGTDLVRAVRQLRADIPILLMSGRSGPDLEERAERLGVAEVLRKPLQRRDLAEAMARIFRPVAGRRTTGRVENSQ